MTNQEPNYLSDLAYMMKRLYTPKFATLWETPTRKGEWTGRFKLAQNFAFIFAVLYEYFQEERYLENAKKHFLDFDQGYHFTSMFFGNTYEIVKPYLTADEIQQVSEKWVQEAQPVLDRFVISNLKDIPNQHHITNHQLCACLYADYAAYLFPDVANPYQYHKFTDIVWDTWWNHREFYEQASNYEGFSECFHCKWAELRGVKEEFYNSPTIQNMFRRNLQVVTPMGTVAAYGDSGHFEHASAWIALFEKIATETRNSIYKKAARIILEDLNKHGYTGNIQYMARVTEENIYNGRMLFAQFIHQLSWIAQAALWSDSTVQSTSDDLPHGIIYRIDPSLTYDQPVRAIPDDKKIAAQVALCGGYNQESQQTYVLASVGEEMIHDHADAGAIHVITKGRGIFLNSNGYLQRELAYHNLFYIQPADWKKFPEDHKDRMLRGDPKCKGTILDYQEKERYSYVKMEFDPYHKYDVQVIQEIMVNSNGEVILTYRALAREDGLVGGPLFHGTKITKTGNTQFSITAGNLQSMCGLYMKNEYAQMNLDLLYPMPTYDIRNMPSAPIYKKDYKGFPVCHYKNIWDQSYSARRCLAFKYNLEKEKELIVMLRLQPM